MTEKDRTLWMGNIEPWMTNNYLLSALNKINIFPNKIDIKKFQNKRSYAFLEFSSHEIAEEILNKYNGKYMNNILLKFNWVKRQKEQNMINKNMMIFTVNYFYIIIQYSYIQVILINQSQKKKSNNILTKNIIL